MGGLHCCENGFVNEMISILFGRRSLEVDVDVDAVQEFEMSTLVTRSMNRTQLTTSHSIKKI